MTMAVPALLSLAVSAMVALAVAAVVAAILTGRIIPWLRRRAILDFPNQRSSHSAPTPRGGGIAVIAVIAGAWLAVAASGVAVPGPIALVLAAALGLALVSWRDDVAGLSASVRILAQGGAVMTALALGALPVSLAPLPAALAIAAMVLIWLWFINLFNFMDGIDGIAGVEAAAIGIGVALVAFAADLGAGPVLLGAAMAGAAIGFLRHNWHPARLFLGDVGSVPLGFLLAWLLLDLAMRGLWPAALILPGYFLADASLTLIQRALRKEKLFQAHRRHFYQRAVAGGLSHARVSIMVGLLDLWLIVLAVVSGRGPAAALAALVAALVSIAALLCYFGRAAKTRGSDHPDRA